jgi:hypothetical protein
VSKENTSVDLTPFVKDSPPLLEISDLPQRLYRLELDQLGSVRIIVLDVPGKGLFLTKELFEALEEEQELFLTCDTYNFSFGFL